MASLAGRDGARRKRVARAAQALSESRVRSRREGRGQPARAGAWSKLASDERGQPVQRVQAARLAWS